MPVSCQGTPDPTEEIPVTFRDSVNRAIPPSSRPTPRWARLAAVPVVVAAVGLGVWVTGGLLTDDEGVARMLTGAWFGVAGVVVVLAALRWRRLAVPVLAAYAVAVGALGGYLMYSSSVDQVVDEAVVVADATGLEPTSPAPGAGATPSAGGTAAGTPSAGASASAPGAPTAPARAVRIASGGFVSKAHPTSGTAAVIRKADGSLVVTLTNLDTDPGPDLRVYIAAGDGSSLKGGIDLGKLKGNKGTQQYAVPAGVSERDLGAVVIWCRAFSVSFGVAALEA
jgi:hypothetical protein